MVSGVYAYFVQINVGLASTNMSDIVSWGFYIANFTFLVSVAAAAVMIILPSYIFKDKDLHKVVIVGEVVAIGALVMCLMFVFVDLGAPWNAWHMIPIIGLFDWPTAVSATLKKNKRRSKKLSRPCAPAKTWRSSNNDSASWSKAWRPPKSPKWNRP
jgi:Ni/Fe-hydrogenase subunit HybB-like protein